MNKKQCFTQPVGREIKEGPNYEAALAVRVSVVDKRFKTRTAERRFYYANNLFL